MGNLGQACREMIEKCESFELVGVFSRRNIDGAHPIDEISNFKDDIDVVLVCVGSHTDAPNIVPKLAENFTTVDSFDTHGEMEKYIDNIRSSRGEKCVNIVGAGWDPGLFSVMRMYARAFFASPPQTFWGPGVSLGHTNAIKNVRGVKNAIQFTEPINYALVMARKGVELSPRNQHKRICYVVANKSDQKRIRREIETMPHYFELYQTEVNFVSAVTFDKKFAGRTEHGGHVIAADSANTAEFALRLRSNSHFTAKIMLTYAAAAVKLCDEGKFGVFTVADIAPGWLIQNAAEYI